MNKKAIICSTDELAELVIDRLLYLGCKWWECSRNKDLKKGTIFIHSDGDLTRNDETDMNEAKWYGPCCTAEEFLGFNLDACTKAPDAESTSVATDKSESTEEAAAITDYYQGTSVDDFIALFKLDFRSGNVIKYVARAGKKDEKTLLEDLKKARWNLERKIVELEGAK